VLNRLVEHKSLSKPIPLRASDSLKVVLTVQDGNTPKRPHQAFLLLKDTTTGLDTSYPLSVKESGKAKVDLVGSHWLLPIIFLILDRLIKIYLHNS
jgi:oligosaccharyltransferase complex subunit delta (ribophorin II)